MASLDDVFYALTTIDSRLERIILLLEEVSENTKPSTTDAPRSHPPVSYQ